MKHRVAKQALREKARIQAEADAAHSAEIAANAEADRLLGAAHAVDVEFTSAQMRLDDLEDRQRELNAWRTDTIAKRAFWAAEQRDNSARANAAARVANLAREASAALEKRLGDPRFAAAEAVIADSEARRAVREAPARAVQAAPLSTETTAGLLLLKKAFDPKAIRRPSHRVVHEDGAEHEFLAEPCDVCGAPEGKACDEKKHRQEEVSIPCPDCGAAVGVACDESVKHEE